MVPLAFKEDKENKEIKEEDEEEEGKGIYKRLTEGLLSDKMDMEEFLRLREELIQREPFYYEAFDYFKAKCFICLRPFIHSKQEIRRIKRRHNMFKKAKKKLK